MKDELISFETAKLAKEKGFNEDVRHFHPEWDDLGVELFDCTSQGMGEWLSDDPTSVLGYGEVVPVCTQSLLQRWLRDNYNIDVLPYLENVNREEMYKVNVSHKTKAIFPYVECFEHFTYEEALEVGLRETLKKL